MFKKVLIANRGEIAVRLIRACRDMGIISVSVHSTADREAMHTHLADESVCIGGPYARDSYLNMRAVISAARAAGAEAIHPGYGFLSENAEFARLCGENGLVFIGPPARAIALMGDKVEARRLMREAGVPVTPGSEGAVATLDEARAVCADIGYPVMVKAAGGGGGKGIRRVNSEDELAAAFDLCRGEAGASFGTDGLYIEKCVVRARHIEFQVAADSHGNAVHLFERDCSLQRRNQKLIEEAPSPFMTPELRTRMGAAAVAACRAAGYENVGTVEFLVGSDGSFYFMEMNTRIQVEHPVTEMLTGVDLANLSIRLAAGEELGFEQDDLRMQGHVIECRINAEDPAAGFKPCPGRIAAMSVPGGPGVRVDMGVYQGCNVPPFYDSLIAKLIVLGADRAQAIARSRRALAEFLFGGIETNVYYQLELLSDPGFVAGKTHTAYVDERPPYGRPAGGNDE